LRRINGLVHAVGLLQRLQLRSAARRYARSLGPGLQRDYGASETYNPQQIRATARRLGLPETSIDLGYPMFLPEATFDEVATVRQPGRRQALIDLYRRHQRRIPPERWTKAEITTYVPGFPDNTGP
jgi:hypothetical protein